MKLLFDLFPVILFFIAFKTYDIYVATAVAIGASVLQIAWIYLRGKKPELMQWMSLGIIAVFGGMTLYLQDEMFIKWKPTVLYLTFAGALIVGRLMGKNFITKLMGEKLELPPAQWNQLNWAWIGFFLFMAALNLVIAFNFSTDLWVQYKLFGTLIMTVLFVFGQALWMSRYLKEENPS